MRTVLLGNQPGEDATATEAARQTLGTTDCNAMHNSACSIASEAASHPQDSDFLASIMLLPPFFYPWQC